MELTNKQKQFLKEYFKTKNATEAAWRSYDCKNRMSANRIGSENLAKLGINNEIQFWLEEVGLTDGKLAEDLKNIRNKKDWRAKIEAIKIEMKLKNLDKSLGDKENPINVEFVVKKMKE